MSYEILFKSKKNITILLILIIISSLPLKLYTIDFTLPEIEDTWLFVLRGIAHSNGDYAESPIKPSGYPLFVSIFFNIFQPNDYVEHVNILRYLNIIISSAIIFPIYLLARKFFNEKFSLLAPVFFAFQPQLNYNTGQGLSEPLFLLILISGFVLLLSKTSHSSKYFSFILLGFLFWIKFNGLFFVLPFIICHAIIHKNIKNLIICSSLFLLTISPILFMRYEEYGNPIYYQISSGSGNLLEQNVNFISIAINNFFTAWATISLPYLLFLFPLGMIYSRLTSLKTNFKHNWIFFILSFLPMLIFYAGDPSSRPSFYIYPFLIMFSVLAVNSIINTPKFSFTFNQKIILIILLLIFVVISSVLVTYGWNDFGYSSKDPILINEIRDYTGFLVNDIDGNLFWSKGVSYSWLPVAMIENSNGDFHNYKIPNNGGKEVYQISSLEQFYPTKLNVIYFESSSINDFLKKSHSNKIQYISIGEYNDLKFLDEIYLNEEKFPYLDKIYDSHNIGNQKYNVKLFKINQNELLKFLEDK